MVELHQKVDDLYSIISKQNNVKSNQIKYNNDNKIFYYNLKEFERQLNCINFIKKI